MSGHKRKFISISEEEYTRLHEAELKVRVFSDQTQRRFDGIAHESQAALWQAVRETQSRQAHFQEAVRSFGVNIQEIEDRTGNLLTAYHQRLAVTVETALGHLNAQFDHRLEEAAERFEHEAARLHHENRETAQALMGYLEAHDLDRARKQETAAGWLANAAGLVDLIRSEYPLDPESSRQVEAMEADLETAAENLDNGFLEASLPLTQSVVAKAMSLRVDLERQIQEQQVFLQAALARAQQIRVMAEDLQYVQAVSLDGSPVPYEIHVDYWSGGKLSGLLDRVGRLVVRLEHQPESFAQPDLDTLLQNTLPALQIQLDEIVREARWNALNSQLRINIADLAIQALESQGFELTEAGYSQEDVRLGYSARVKDYAGNEVRLSVEPVSGAAVQNELHIESGDAELRTEHELLRRDLEISKALQGFGLQVMGLRLQEPAAAPHQADRGTRSLPQQQSYVRKGPSPA